MKLYKYTCELATPERMETTTYTIQAENEDAAYEEAEKRLWKEWEGVEITRSKTTIEEV